MSEARTLRLYRDEDGLDEITDENPDYIKKPVMVDGTLTDVTEIYMKSADPNLTFENISLTTVGDEDGASDSGEVDVSYSLDGSNYVQILPLPDGDYENALKIYRKAVAPNVAKAFKRLEISHDYVYDEYVR